MKNKYPLGTMFVRTLNNDHGIVIRVKAGHDNLTPIYSIAWTCTNGAIYDYTEEELGRWYIKV